MKSPEIKPSLLRLLEERGYESERARGLILSGRVLVEGRPETRVHVSLDPDVALEVREEKEYVSRAAYKLLGALRDFALSPEGRVCLDLGAAHGGFTQVLLERGAVRVYALDVAYGMIDYGLRRDERVVMLERRNARRLAADWLLPEDLARPDGLFVTSDLSFISLRSVLPALAELARALAGPLEGVLLIKPQFEASERTEKGVLRDPEAREAVLADVMEAARGLGFVLEGPVPADITGEKGNQEYAVRVVFGASSE